MIYREDFCCIDSIRMTKSHCQKATLFIFTKIFYNADKEWIYKKAMQSNWQFYRLYIIESWSWSKIKLKKWKNYLLTSPLSHGPAAVSDTTSCSFSEIIADYDDAYMFLCYDFFDAFYYWSVTGTFLGSSEIEARRAPCSRCISRFPRLRYGTKPW